MCCWLSFRQRAFVSDWFSRFSERLPPEASLVADLGKGWVWSRQRFVCDRSSQVSERATTRGVSGAAFRTHHQRIVHTDGTNGTSADLTIHFAADRSCPDGRLCSPVCRQASHLCRSRGGAWFGFFSACVRSVLPVQRAASTRAGAGPGREWRPDSRTSATADQRGHHRCSANRVCIDWWMSVLSERFGGVELWACFSSVSGLLECSVFVQRRGLPVDGRDQCSVACSAKECIQWGIGRLSCGG